MKNDLEDIEYPDEFAPTDKKTVDAEESVLPTEDDTLEDEIDNLKSVLKRNVRELKIAIATNRKYIKELYKLEKELESNFKILVDQQ